MNTFLNILFYKYFIHLGLINFIYNFDWVRFFRITTIFSFIDFLYTIFLDYKSRCVFGFQKSDNNFTHFSWGGYGEKCLTFDWTAFFIP